MLDDLSLLAKEYRDHASQLRLERLWEDADLERAGKNREYDLQIVTLLDDPRFPYLNRFLSDDQYVESRLWRGYIAAKDWLERELRKDATV